MIMAQLLDTDIALEKVLGHSPDPVPERVTLADALGRVILEPITAAVSQPPFDKAMMDGFAVTCQDAGAQVTRVGEVAAGSTPDAQVAPGKVVEVMTGAPCPHGTEAVVKVEDVTQDKNLIKLPPEITSGQNIQPEGLLCRPGDEILPAGTVLGTVSLAAAVAVGTSEAIVGKRPSIALITTGDELANPGDKLKSAQIYDSNGLMLEAQARLAGAGVIKRLHAQDTRKALTSALEEVANSDIIVLSGGVSMGRYDLVPEVVEALGWTRVFHKVRQKPGKPIFFAHRGSQLAFGLPGTPLGSHLGFHRFVSVAIRKRLGLPTRRKTHMGQLAENLTSRGKRTLFRLARATRSGDHWQIHPLRWGGSSDLVGPSLGNCYLRFEPGEKKLLAGEKIPFEFVDGLPEDQIA